MNGRLELDIKIESEVEELLKACPEYVREWYEVLLASGKTAMSCKGYVNMVKKFLKSIDDDTSGIEIDDITQKSVLDYFKSIKTKKTKIDNGKYELKETSDSYKQTIWCCLNNFFSFMDKQGYIDKNYMEIIDKPKNKDLVRINENRVLLTKEDFKKIIKTIEMGYGDNSRSLSQQGIMLNRNLCIFYIFMTTGIRRSALSSINISDINFDNNELKVKDKGNIWHSYQLTNLTIEYIKDWLFDREDIIKEETDALFISRNGRRMSSQAIYDLVVKVCDEALGYHISPHKLRSGFCSIMYNETNDIEKVRRMVGHSNIATTQRYIVTGGNEKEEASAIMTDIFG